MNNYLEKMYSRALMTIRETFCEGLDFRPDYWTFRGRFRPALADSVASGHQKSIPDDLTDLGTQNESSGACLRPDFGHAREKCVRFLKSSNVEIKKSQVRVSISYLEVS